MMKLLVCSTDNRNCMIHRCSDCLSSDILSNHQLNIIGEYDDKTEVTYKQWVTTDRSTLSQITTPVQEFVSVVINSPKKLTMHSYIVKSQSSYLRHLKITLTRTLSFFWWILPKSLHLQSKMKYSLITGTLHRLHYILFARFIVLMAAFIAIPFALYLMTWIMMYHWFIKYKKNVFCMSEDTEFDKNNYFSDGCTAQYKN